LSIWRSSSSVRHVGQVALVVLDDVRELVERVALLGEVRPQVLDRLEVRFRALDLRVGDEDDAVDPLQDELAARVVEDLPRHRVEVEARLEAADLAERQRQEVEEERALRLRREADHLPLRLGVRALVDVLEVRRLPAETGAVIDQLAVDLASHVVDEAHSGALSRLISR
jgi:acyl-CoA hydrolase